MRAWLSTAWHRSMTWTIPLGVTAVLIAVALADDVTDVRFAPVAMTVVVGSGLALAAQRTWPRTVLVVTGLCAVVYQSLGVDLPAIAFLFAVYAAMRAGRRGFTVAVSIVIVAAFPLIMLASGSDVGSAIARARDILEIAWVVAAAAAGEAVRQAERRADEAERTREEALRRRANEERLHIARELHDSLIHQISVIKIQSDVVVQTADKQGTAVSDSVRAIHEASREADRELRATLEMLRDKHNECSYGLDDLPDLVRRVTTTGPQTRLTVRGEPYDVSPEVGLTSYRIVQEALTNASRHASAANADVYVDYRTDGLALLIEDDGDGTPGSPVVFGTGLTGMRERVHSLGGGFVAGPRDEGGFRVRADRLRKGGS
ncbi:sensor histidine kinase [Haloglycomyces albus]|uniref:sensor histidine kinase n=1 Tax=Haloglycomyces albus TaxID=526067 RepID=UPI0006851C4F|nr:sensor histidine kinase [Haloglycomyces albus]